MNSALSVFIVDDDPVFQIVLNLGISQTGLPKELKTFNNGKEAIDYLDRQKIVKGNMLVFLDINMPVMNGWDFLDELQGKIYKKQVAVIVTSTSTLTEDRNRAHKYPQVLFYQEKPIKLNLIKSLVEEIFVNHDARQCGEGVK
jgi:CheY-like chemotaxis protein